MTIETAWQYYSGFKKDYQTRKEVGEGTQRLLPGKGYR